MSNLKTDYKDDVFSGKRKYNQINNVDGTISFEDVTDYAQVGDSYGAAQINEINDTVNNINNKGYKNDDAAETSIADNDYFPFFDASANAKKNTLWSNIKSVLTNVFAIKNHAANSTVYGAGNANVYGHVKLSDNYASSAGAAASAVAASSKAVNDAFNTNKNSINSLSGTVTSNKTTETNHYNSLNTRTTALEGELTANNKRIYMDYKNGKYGINTSANRGADSFVPFKAGLTITVRAGSDGSWQGDDAFNHSAYAHIWISDGTKTVEVDTGSATARNENSATVEGSWNTEDLGF